jgi:hypothetical protein
MREQAVINSQESLQTTLGQLREAFNEHKYLRVSYRIGKSRSEKQNKHSHAWYTQLARELKEDDAIGWKCYCKLNFGVPILRTEDAEFRDMYDSAIKSTLSYEQKLKAMKYLPVTSLMTRKQLKAYEEAMQVHFRDNHGVELTYKKDGEDENV